MSDDLDITSGGAISVDSGFIRDIGVRLAAVGRQLAEAVELLRRAHGLLAQAPTLVSLAGTAGMIACMQRLTAQAELVAGDAHGVAVMADTFELVELRNEQDALSIHHPDRAVALQARIDELLQRDEKLEDRAAWLLAGQDQTRFQGTEDQFLDGLLPGVRGWASGPGPVGLTLAALAGIAAHTGAGLIPTGTRLRGSAPPVQVQLVARGSTAPAANLRESISRIPYGQPGQIAVERYRMRDGSVRFVAYLDGTRSMRSGGDEPWDMGSNVDMYLDREQSASQVATEKALQAAGMQPGDRLDIVGYSQGAVIGGFAATDGTYDVGTLITAGSPIEPALHPDQTLIELRHRGDPVSNLAGGGSPGGGGGAPGSFTAWASTDPVQPLQPHGFDDYVDTAAAVDGSGDPRVRMLHETHFAELGEAVEVEVMQFQATRP